MLSRTAIQASQTDQASQVELNRPENQANVSFFDTMFPALTQPQKNSDAAGLLTTLFKQKNHKTEKIKS